MIARILAASAVLWLTGPVEAISPLQSGPQVGSLNNRNGFFPQWVTGPCAGQQLCPV
jgi:hypothetical protein